MITGSEAVLEWADVKVEDIDLVIPHQANINIIEMVRKRLKIDPDKVVITIQKYGNNSSGCVPLALHEAHVNGRIKNGDLVLLTTVGAGLSTETALIRW
jgi:3-oxoacyl-[acyl-carrier-protein] synthase-3